MAVYFLCHKNIKVLKIEYNADTNQFGKVISVENEKHIPVGIGSIGNKTLSQGLQFWWNSRLLPKNRSGYNSGNSKIDLLFINSHGFNLSDQYWIKPENSRMTWNKGNFFLNEFNEDLGKFITGITKSGVENMSSDSPDLFSNGEQDKRWVIERGKRKLIKYGHPPYYEQPFNEVLATEICRRLNFPHVPYKFLVKGNSYPFVYSSCECFIDEDTEFVPAGFIQYALPKGKGVSSYNHILNCCEALGMKNIDEIKTSIAQMILLDFIIGNVDRHFGNFGFIRNAKTLEWKGLVPIFDSGNAMFYEYPTSDLRKSRALMENVPSKCFAQTQKAQLKKFANSVLCLNVDFSRLNGIERFYENILAQNPKVDDERTSLLCSLLLKRIELAKDIISGNFDKNGTVALFLSSIQKELSGDDFFRAVSEVKKVLCKQDPANEKIIDNYLIRLGAKNPVDMEMKIKMDIM